MKASSAIILCFIAISARAGDASPPVRPVKAVIEPAKKEEWIRFDVEERLRLEIRENTRDFNGAVNEAADDTWLLNRFRFGLLVQPIRGLKFYVQTQDAREWDSERANIPGVNGAEGDDAFDLRQAYVQIGGFKDFPVTLTLGRQALNYGDRRLVADSVWGNFGRTFDAVRLRAEGEKWWAEAFFARPVQIKTEVFNDSDAADNFAGLYLSSSALSFQTTDLYAFYRDRGDNQPDLSPTGTDPRGASGGPASRFVTVGMRFDSNEKALAGWDYNFEAAYQNGDVWTGDRKSTKVDLKAYAIHAGAGYSFATVPLKPRLGAEYNFASGDHNPDDGDSQSFQNLFPSNHDKYGLMDTFGWRNLHDARALATLHPTKSLETQISYHAYWLADTADYAFRSNGVNGIRTQTSAGLDVRRVGASQFAGQEIDVVVKWLPTSWLTVDVGYAHFFVGDYFEETGTSDDADFGYVQTTFKF